ncbi:YciI family protein [Gynuella sunshinyii]|uniref:YCII-related domain-containing protein n=1 Tax=Gynuella sunshinyii YC6258 TaxID=1445510 RepID=A0A0C5V8T3_9GAMM|nr:YciI family protein [Gynuella sunshinyii]AJQ95745.1 hypothetical protein YC6258_03709 [Gynuella sunshinyii YC6258]
MFIVLLKFSDNKAKASEYMDSHNAWIKKGFDDDVFLLVGSIEPGAGGSVIAHNSTLEEIQSRVNDDPFVSEDVVKAEIIEISPKKADERLSFLLA